MIQMRLIKGEKTQFDLYQLGSLIAGLKSGEYILTIKKVRKGRTHDQNSYYWKVISIIAEYTGYDPNELHEHFKFRYLRSTSKPQRVLSTTELDTKAMSEYTEKIILFASELSDGRLVIMTPEEYYAAETI